MTHWLTSAPAVEPVTLAELRAQLRLVQTEEDGLLASLIKAAREHVEQVTRRALITQGWRIALDGWPAGRILRLPLAPVLAVTAVTVYGADGMPVTLAPAAWTLRRGTDPARLVIAPGMGPEPVNGLEIDFTAGYGASPTDVPEPLRQAVRMLAAHWYEHREAGTELAMASLPFGLDRLLMPFRMPLL